MSYGFLALNASNQVLISSDTRNLHFVGKYSSPTVDSQTDYYGGMRRLMYTVSCDITPVPFFTLPTNDFVGITAIHNASPGVWHIEVIRSGTGTVYPELYVFADPRGKTSTDTHGMIVYADDGTPAFDSRLTPLVVTGGLAVSHPSNPRPTFPYGLSSDYCGSMGSAAGGFFAPTEYNSYSVSAPSKPMFHYASLAQAEREASYSRSERDCLGVDAYGSCWGYGTEEFWRSYYWCFYRGGIRYSAGTLQAGWVACYFGCNWSYQQDDSLFGIGVGGDGGSSGAWPYSNETLNLNSTAVIIGDASKYD